MRRLDEQTDTLVREGDERAKKSGCRGKKGKKVAFVVRTDHDHVHVKDASMMSAALSMAGFDVTQFDPKGTKSLKIVINAILNRSKKMGRCDKLLLYVVGHSNFAWGGDRVSNGDYSLWYLNPVYDEKGNGKRWDPPRSIPGLILAVAKNVGQVNLVLESCSAGAVIKPLKKLFKKATGSAKKATVHAYTSSADGKQCFARWTSLFGRIWSTLGSDYTRALSAWIEYFAEKHPDVSVEGFDLVLYWLMHEFAVEWVKAITKKHGDPFPHPQSAIINMPPGQPLDQKKDKRGQIYFGLHRNL